MIHFTRNTDDGTLWNYFRKGDEHAYTELARRYYRILLQYGQRFTPNAQIIEDSLQDLLVHLWLHRDSINDTPSVHFYLLKAFRHRILKTLKPLTEVELTTQMESEQPEFSYEDSLIQVETDLTLKKQVKTALDQLPARQQEVIYLRFFQNLKPEEIANLLSIHPQSVSNIIQRAIQNLRGMWNFTSHYSLLFYSFYQTFY